MKIVDVKACSVAIPFTAPIQSAFGVSYPARIRTIIRVITDEGIEGIGECGYSPLATFRGTSQAAAFEGPIKRTIAGENPFSTDLLRRKLGYTSEESVAVEMACWDIMGKATGLPVYRLLRGDADRKSVEHSVYCFFRAPDENGRNAVTLDNIAQHCADAARAGGFGTVKLKVGVHPPDDEVDAVIRLRELVGPRVKIVLDPNGAWSLGTAIRVAKKLEACDILYYEDPIRYDVAGNRRLRQATQTPICVGCFSGDQLRHVLESDTVDVVQADLYASGGLRGTNDWYAVARTFQRPAAMHSGREIGVAQLAKMHVVAAQPDTVYATDGIYNQYVDDVLVGGKLAYENGCLPLPQQPGLGVELDEERLARWELTDEVHQRLDQFWAQTKQDLGIGLPNTDNTIRRY